MINFLSSLSAFLGKEILFWICALVGTCFFVIQFLFNILLGSDEDTGNDSENFQWLSKQAIIGFFMMFGWTGLTCRKEFDFSGLISAIIAFGCGIVTVVIIGYIFKMAKKLRSSGTVFCIEDTIGKKGTVYQRIPKGGMGKISLSIHNFTHEIDAIAQEAEELSSFTQVKVIKTVNDKIVVVVPI